MTKIVKPGIVATFGRTRAFGRAAWVVCGACLWLASASHAGADSLTSQTPSTGSPLPGDTNVVATYDGGSISAGDVAEARDEPRFVADAEQNAPTNAVSLDEKIARHLAATRILVSEARRRGFDRPVDPEAAKAGPQPQHHPYAQAGPGWALEQKLIEQRVLAQALEEEMRRSVTISEQEVEDQYRTNRFRMLGFETVEAGRIGISAQKHGEGALERAKEALGLIRKGEDFVAVARQYSDLDPKLAQTAPYPAAFWGKESGLVLADLGGGKVSDPVPVEDGYELIRIARLHLADNPSPEQAKARLRLMLNGLAVQERVEEMAKAAEAAFPFVTPSTNSSPSTLNTQPSTNLALLRCGQFVLMREEVRGLAAERGAQGMDDQQMVEMLKQEGGYHIQMGEMARSMGYDKRPDVRRALRYELDRQLAEKARRVLLPELAAEMTFPEEQVRGAYDTKFTATFPPQMEYDALVVPVRVPAEATVEEREAVRTNAQGRAEEIIRRVQDGARLEDIAGGDTTLQWVPGQSRVVNENSALAPLVAGLEAGAVAALPYEDFGGFCVLRVGKSEARRKMPYEIAKNYIVNDFRNEAMRDFHRYFETALLNKYHFAFGAAAAGRTRDPASTAPAKANNQP